MKYKLVKWGSFLGELCLLPMLYSAALLAPVPFGFIRVGMMLFLAGASCGLAYLASSRIDRLAGMKYYSFVQVISKPPFVVWIVVVTIILLQFANGLLMLYLSSRK